MRHQIVNVGFALLGVGAVIVAVGLAMLLWRRPENNVPVTIIQQVTGSAPEGRPWEPGDPGIQKLPLMNPTLNGSSLLLMGQSYGAIATPRVTDNKGNKWKSLSADLRTWPRLFVFYAENVTPDTTLLIFDPPLDAISLIEVNRAPRGPEKNATPETP